MEKATKVLELIRVATPQPLKGEDFDKFYVSTVKARGQDAALQLSDYFEVNYDLPKKVLFMGHRGAGKSTELYQMERYLGEAFKVINFSVQDEADTTDLKCVDLLFVILNKIFETAAEDKVDINPSLLDNLASYWKDEKFIETIRAEKAMLEVEAGAKVGLGGFYARVKGILQTGQESKKVVREFIEPRLSELINGTNDLIRNIRKEYRKKGQTLLLVIEDLDKLSLQVASDLFLMNNQVLTRLNIHIVYTFPIFLHYDLKYNEIKSAFDHQVFLCMIKTHQRERSTQISRIGYTPGLKVIRDMVERRADLKLFEPEALDLIIEKSGGHLRHVFEMIQRATLYTREKDREIPKVTKEAAVAAFNELCSSFGRQIYQHHLRPLVALYNDEERQPPTDEYLKELLQNTAVIEYNGERWCDLHPAVEEVLIQMGQIKKSERGG